MGAVSHGDAVTVAELEFDRVKRAYELLSDAAARKALDELARVQRARQAKDATQDAKRRKMREELERREKQAARGESELQTARNALNAEVRHARRYAMLVSRVAVSCGPSSRCLTAHVVTPLLGLVVLCDHGVGAAGRLGCSTITTPHGGKRAPLVGTCG